MNKKKAQQIAEFALVVPILLIVILIIMEMGYAINVRSVLSDSIRVAVMEAMDNYTGVDNPTDDFAAELKSEISSVLEDKGFDNNVKIEIVDIPAADKVMVIASTKYEPSFGLNNGFANIIPQEFNLTTYQIVNRNYLEKNDFKNAVVLTEDQLNTFWPDGPTGLMADNNLPISGVPKSDVQKQVAFLIDVSDNKEEKARLFDWEGQDLLPVNSYFDLKRGYYMIKSPYYTNDWVQTVLTIEDVLISMGFTQGIYVKPEKKINIDSTDIADLRKKTEVSNDYKWTTPEGLPFDKANTDKRFGINLVYEAKNKLSGSYEKVNDDAGKLDENDIEEYIFQSTNPTYLLKLYLPTGSLQDDVLKPRHTADIASMIATSRFHDADDRFFQFGGDLSKYYTDTDGDYIPDQYDSRPTFSDDDLNGELDGKSDKKFTPDALSKYREANIPKKLELDGSDLEKYMFLKDIAYDPYKKFFFQEPLKEEDIIPSDKVDFDASGNPIDPSANNEPVEDNLSDFYDKEGNNIDIISNPLQRGVIYYDIKGNMINSDKEFVDNSCELLNIKLGDEFEIDSDNSCDAVGKIEGRLQKVELRKKYVRLIDVGNNDVYDIKYKNNFNNQYYKVKRPSELGLFIIRKVKFEEVNREEDSLGFCMPAETEIYEPLYYCDGSACYREVTEAKPELELSANVKRDILRGLDASFKLNTTKERTLRNGYFTKLKNSLTDYYIYTNYEDR